MKKIVFGITSLTLGGAERVLVDIANELSDKYDITIFTIYAKGELEKQLKKKIKLVSMYDCSYLELNKLNKKIIPLKVLIGKSKIYNKYIKDKYDIEIAFLEGAITRIFSCGKEQNRKIAWIHNDIAKVFGNNVKAKIKGYIDKKTYNKFETLVFVSNDNKNTFEKKYKTDNNKILIYNYIDSEKVLDDAKKEIKEKFEENRINLVTVARLVEQKAIDRLINIHSRLIKEGYKHNIYVVGDGPLKEKLQKLIQKLNLENTFKLLGKRDNPYPYIYRADYFILLSNYEGYGMVLEEAKILNKDIIITNTAARETIKNYDKGQVLDNSEEAIYEGLKHIIQNCKNIKEDSLTKVTTYDNTHIMKEIINLIEKGCK